MVAKVPLCRVLSGTKGLSVYCPSLLTSMFASSYSFLYAHYAAIQAGAEVTTSEFQNGKKE